MDGRDNKTTIAVTGATGYIGSHTIRLLLAKGFGVHAIVHNLQPEQNLTHLIDLQNRYSTERLRFFQADLVKGDSILHALAGCEAAIHAAGIEAWNHKTLIDSNTSITHNVLDGIEKSPNIKKLVYSSAVNTMWSYYKHNTHVFTEQDYNTDHNLQREDPYSYCKITEENAVFAKARQISTIREFSCVTTNAPFVIGPALSPIHLHASSHQLIHDLYVGTLPALPRMYLPFVDVRNVAEAHVAALSHNTQADRFIVAASGAWLTEVAQLIKKNFPSCRVPLKAVPDWCMYLQVALFEKRIPLSLLRHRLGRRLECSGTKAATTFGIKYYSLEESLVATISELKKLSQKSPARV